MGLGQLQRLGTRVRRLRLQPVVPVPALELWKEQVLLQGLGLGLGVGVGVGQCGVPSEEHSHPQQQGQAECRSLLPPKSACQKRGPPSLACSLQARA